MRTSDKVLQWAEQKGILEHGTVYGQLTKLREEVLELEEALVNHDAHEVVDAIGDIQVVLIILAEIYGISAQDCLDKAYQVIAQRTGKMVNGVFVKDE